MVNLKELGAAIAAHEEAVRVSDRAYARKRQAEEAAKAAGLPEYWEVGLKDPTYLDMQSQASAAHKAAEAVSGAVIRANLEVLGLEDPVVTGTLTEYGTGREIAQTRALLSELCSKRWCGVAEALGLDAQGLGLQVKVLDASGRRLGAVDCDGRFNYDGAESLRSALAWLFATDAGRVRLLAVDLEAATRAVLETVRTNGTGKEAFFGAFFSVLREIVVHPTTSRFGDGHLGVATAIWMAATREAFGVAHEGYPYGY